MTTTYAEPPICTNGKVKSGFSIGDLVFPLRDGYKTPGNKHAHKEAVRATEYKGGKNHGVSLNDKDGAPMYAVVDVDDPSKVSPAMLKLLGDAPTWAQRTRRGTHYKYRLPDGFKGSNKVFPGGDLKCNGYFVGSESMVNHDAKGNLIAPHVYERTNDLAEAPAPAWLIHLLTSTAESYREGQHRAERDGHPEIIIDEHGNRFVNIDTIDDMSEWGGSCTDRIAMCSMTRKFVEGGFSVERAADMACKLQSTECKFWKAEDPFTIEGPQGLLKIAQDWLAKRAEWTKEHAPQPEAQSTDTTLKAENILKGATVRGIREPIDWLFKPLIPKIGFGNMHGKGKVGKSTVAALMAADATKAGIKVMFLMTEDDPILFYQRAVLMGAKTDLIFWPDPAKVHVNSIKFPKSIKEVDALIESLGIGFLFIDAIMTHADHVATAKLVASEKARVLGEELAAMSGRRKMSILGNYHNMKGSTKALGSEELNNVARYQLSITDEGTGESKRLNAEVENSSGGATGYIMQFRFKTGEFRDPLTGEWQKEIASDDRDADDYNPLRRDEQRQKISYLEIVKKSEQTTDTSKAEGSKEDKKAAKVEESKSVKAERALISLLTSTTEGHISSVTVKMVVKTASEAASRTVEKVIAKALADGKIVTGGTGSKTWYKLAEVVQ